MHPSDESPVARWGLRLQLRLRRMLRVSRRKMPAAPARILAVKLWGLGSLIQTTPALAALRARFPEAHITLLTTKGLETLYAGEAALYDRADTVRVTGGGGVFRGEMRRVRTMAGGEGFDLGICFDGLSPWSAYATLASGAAFTLGHGAAGRCAPFDDAVALEEEKHAVEAQLDLVRHLGAVPASAVPVAPRIRAHEIEQARESLRAWGVDEHALLVGVGLTSGPFAPWRAWPPEKFVLLAQAIEEMGGYKTVFLGAPEEERFVSRHAETMDTRPINLSGRTSVRQLAALLSRMHLYVGPDAGTLHLAAALGVPTVGIFGPESPARSGPPRSERNAVVRRDEACGPCVSFLAGRAPRCLEGERCIRAVPVDAVRSVVEDMLEHLSDPENPPWMES